MMLCGVGGVGLGGRQKTATQDDARAPPALLAQGTQPDSGQVFSRNNIINNNSYNFRNLYYIIGWIFSVSIYIYLLYNIYISLIFQTPGRFCGGVRGVGGVCVFIYVCCI